MDQINFSFGKFHIASMTGFLKYSVRIIVLWFQMVWILALVGFSRNAGNDGILRVFFIWAQTFLERPIVTQWLYPVPPSAHMM